MTGDEVRQVFEAMPPQDEIDRLFQPCGVVAQQHKLHLFHVAVLGSCILKMASWVGNMGRAVYIYLLIIITLSSLLNIFALRKGHDWGDDFALYIAQAKSLVEGKTMELLEQNTFTVSHSSIPFGPNIAPWGFPIILSPIYAISGLNLLAMKILGIFFFELSLVVIFSIFFGKLDNILNLLLVAFFAFNPFFLSLNDRINSDIPYLFFSLFSIFMMRKVTIDDKFSKYGLTGFVITGLLIFSSYSIRPIGSVLLCLLLTSQMIPAFRIYGKRFIEYFLNDKLRLLPYGIFIISGLAMHLILPSWAESYLSPFSHANLTLAKNNSMYYSILPAELFGPHFSLLIYGSTIPFTALGIIRVFRIDYLYLVYSAIMMFILILIPYIEGLRYILPILPFFIYFFCTGLDGFLAKSPLASIYFAVRIKIAYIFMAFLVSLLISYSVQIAYANFDNKNIIDGPFTEESHEMFNFILYHTKESDIIIFFKPRVLRLLTGRPSIMQSDFSQISEKSGDYLVILKTGGSYNQISPSSKEFLQVIERFPRVFENVDFITFRLKRFADTD